VTGGTSSVDLPLTANAYSRTPSNSFAVKISPDGKLLWSSYLDQDAGARLAVDAAGAVYFASSFRDNASFVEKLSADLKTRVYKTPVLNGAASGIAVDRQGNATVVGSTSSTAFPATQGALQSTLNGQTGTRDGFVMKLDPSGGVVYATFLGGASGDQADAVALDADGSAYIVGTTASTNFPVTPGAYQSTLRANCGYASLVTVLGDFSARSLVS
jgi:hypothetical protein